MYASTNVDPADDGVDIDVSGGTQTIDPPGRAIHCDTSGTCTFRLTRHNTVMTRTLKAGGIYAYAVNQVIAVGAGFTGAIMR